MHAQILEAVEIRRVKAKQNFGGGLGMNCPKCGAAMYKTVVPPTFQCLTTGERQSLLCRTLELERSLATMTAENARLWEWIDGLEQEYNENYLSKHDFVYQGPAKPTKP